MAAPDMDVIKEIPGYKVILKAVLKNQIQQLVEQLASHTEEESIILTASISDGTLSHLGSDSGKFFLDDHEDVKSLFLGFCLKHHHKKKQKEEEEKERERQEKELERQRQMMSAAPIRYTARPRYVSPQGPRYGAGFSPRQGPYGMRSPTGRHEPYPITRPQKRPSLNFNPQTPGASKPGGVRPPSNNQSVKIEPIDEDSNQSAGGATTPKRGESTSSQPGSPSQGTPGKTDNTDDDAKSNSSNSTIPNEASEMKFSDTQPAEGLGLDSDLSNLISGERSANQPSTSVSSDIDPNVNVKLEAISENDMELEITGVEPGMSSVDTSWAQNTSMGYDPMGATGSQADMQGQDGYNLDLYSGTQQGDLKMYTCRFCQRIFQFSCHLKIHLRVHTGSKPFQCNLCLKQFSQKSNLNVHLRTIHGSST